MGEKAEPIDAGLATRVFRAIYANTQAELAEDLGVHPSFISRIESGERGCSADTVGLLAKAFAVERCVFEMVGLMTPDQVVGCFRSEKEFTRGE